MHAHLSFIKFIIKIGILLLVPSTNFILNPKYYTLVKVHILRTIKIKFSDKVCIENFNQFIHEGETTSIIKHILHYKTYWKTKVSNFALFSKLLYLS